MLEKLTDTQKIIGLLLVVLVVYILYMMYKTCKNNEHYYEPNKLTKTKTVEHTTEHTTEPKVKIMNTPDVKQDADSYHQPEQKPQDTYRNTNRCIVTAGSEFVGLPNELEGPHGNEPSSNYTDVNGVDGVDVEKTSAFGLGYANISRGTRCGSAQYPPPFKTTTKEDDDRMTNDQNSYVPSGYTGFNGLSDSGNVCITEHHRDFISGRGGNAACADYTKHFVKYDAAGCPA
jgi:hypothetical protein